VPLKQSGVPPEGGWADFLVGREFVFARVFRFVCVWFLRA
jgi:hypothetical protein